MQEVFDAENVLLVGGLLIAAAFTTLASRRLRVPSAVGLVLVGLALGLLARTEPFEWLGRFELTPELILFVLLPVLLFEAAFNLDSRELGDSLAAISALAVPILLVSVALVAAIVAPTVGIPIGVALVFGALISATDPVAVLAIFREIGAPRRLGVLVDGESLFNDGTAFVVFAILVGIVTTGAVSAGVIFAGLGHFALVVAGGLALGALGAFLVAQIVGRIHGDRLAETTFVLTLGYIVFVLADHFLHVSGVMAAVAAGLVMGNYGRTKISPSVLEHVHSLLQFLAHIANSLIFLLVGLSVDLGSLAGSAGAVGWAILAVLVARGLAMFLAMPLVNRFQAHPISLKYQAVMYWGGLRGAMALALVLSLQPDFEHRDILLNLTLGVVLFTLLFQGLSIRPLMRVLGLQRYTLGEAFERRSGVLLARRAIAAKLQTLRDHAGELSSEVAHILSSEAGLASLSTADAAADTQLDRIDAALELEILLRHALASEIKIYERLYAEGDLAERSMKRLVGDAHTRLDEVKIRGVMGRRVTHADRNKLLTRLIRILSRVPGARGWAERLDALEIAGSYQSDRAELIAIDEILEEIADIAKAGAASRQAADAACEPYRTRQKVVQARLDETARQFAEYVRISQAQIARRYLLHVQGESHAHLYEIGILSEKVFDELQAENIAALRALQIVPTGALRISPAEALGKVPLFASLDADTLREIERRLRPRSVREGVEILAPDSKNRDLHLLARGTAELQIVKAGQDLDSVHLGPGDFFGELRLISGVSAGFRATSTTPCNLLILSAHDLHVLGQKHPSVGEAIRSAYKSTILVDLLRRVPYFAMLNDSELKDLAGHFEWESYAAGATIFTAGDVGDTFSIVRRGSVELVDDAAAGLRPQRLLGEGDFFGELALMGESVRQITARAATAVETLTMTRATFLSLLETLPAMRDRV